MTESRMKFLEREVARLSNMIDRDAQRPRGPVLKNRFTPWGVWQGDSGTPWYNMNSGIVSSSDAMFTSIQTGGSPNTWGCRINLAGWYRVCLAMVNATSVSGWSGSAGAYVQNWLTAEVSTGGSALCTLQVALMGWGQTGSFRYGGNAAEGIFPADAGDVVYVTETSAPVASVAVSCRLTIERIG